VKFTTRLTLLFAIAASVPTLFASDRSTCATPFEMPFRQASELRLDLRAGDIDISGTDDAVVRVICELKEQERAEDIAITFEDNGKYGRLRIRGGPDGDVRLRIQVPRQSNLIVRCTAGDLDVTGVRGNKDVALRAGDLTIEVGNPDDYALAEATVTAGDVNASAFGVHKGGLFRKFRRENSGGKYHLRASLWAGDIKLR
jgi:hypothetical protein